MKSNLASFNMFVANDLYMLFVWVKFVALFLPNRILPPNNPSAVLFQAYIEDPLSSSDSNYFPIFRPANPRKGTCEAKKLPMSFPVPKPLVAEEVPPTLSLNIDTAPAIIAYGFPDIKRAYCPVFLRDVAVSFTLLFAVSLSLINDIAIDP